MNIIIKLNGTDVTSACLLTATKITFDSSKRITTASISIMAAAMGELGATSRYDSAIYDRDTYSLTLRDLIECVILDGRDGVTKLFDGQITAMTLQQSDAPGFSVFYQCDMSDWAAYLDRSVCWDTSFPLTLPNSDKGIILALLGHFCPRITLPDIAQIVPTIYQFDWATKSCRQVLDDLSTLSMGSWRVDFDGGLHYYLAASAPPAPFGLSTSPDYVTTFPVRIDGYKQDFTNPINHAYVRGGADPTTGVAVTADYADPVSVQTYGEYAAGVVDAQITNGWDAALRAKSMVLTNAYPVETGNFTIWGKDGLECGMQVHLHEDNLGMDGDYTIIQLVMQWVDAETVEYTAQFGAAQPDLETILRLLNQRTVWATSVIPAGSSGSGGPPPPGSVTDSSIAAPGLSASSIQSVNASSISGFIQAGQIQSVNASSISGFIQAGQIQSVNAATINGQIKAGQIESVTAAQIQGVVKAGQIESVSATQITGSIQAGQIAAVNATSISGSIQAGQISSVNATQINGVIVSSQLADQIINNLSKYVTALTPIQMVKTTDPWPPTMPNKNFPPGSFFYYQPNGQLYQVTPDGLTWTANSNPQNTLMSFYYIGAINATSITGLIVAAQIGSVNATNLVGQVQASQIASLSATQITGTLTATQIGSITAGQITGQLTSGQIASVSASVIVGTLGAAQIGAVNANVIQGTLSAAQIGTITAGQIGSINAATITIGQLQDAQIAGVSGAKLSIGSVDSTKFNGYSIDVGGLANLPGRIRVMNTASTVIAQMGALTEVGLSYYGGWFQVFGAGGTSYANAPITTDVNGHLTIKDPSSLTISGQIATGTATFDATYSSLAITNTSSPDSCSFISRGLVFYYNGSKIGSLVRSPNGAWLALECTTGGSYILIDGNAGIRSDGGYKVGSTTVINSSGQVTGQVVGTFAGTISTTSSIYTSSTCQADAGYYGGTFMGAAVNVGGKVTCAGVSAINANITCGTITVQGSGGAALTCANSLITAQGFGIYAVGNGLTLNNQSSITFKDVSGTNWTFRVIGGLIC